MPYETRIRLLIPLASTSDATTSTCQLSCRRLVYMPGTVIGPDWLWGSAAPLEADYNGSSSAPDLSSYNAT